MNVDIGFRVVLRRAWNDSQWTIGHYYYWDVLLPQQMLAAKTKLKLCISAKQRSTVQVLQRDVLNFLVNYDGQQHR